MVNDEVTRRRMLVAAGALLGAVPLLLLAGVVAQHGRELARVEAEIEASAAPTHGKLGARAESQLGVETVGPYMNVATWATPPTFIPADSSATILPTSGLLDATLAPYENEAIWTWTGVTAAATQLCASGDANAETCFGYQVREFEGTNYAGTFISPDGSVFDEAIKGDYFGVLAGTTSRLIYDDAGRISNVVYCPIDCYASTYSNYVRGILNPDANADAALPPTLNALSYPLYQPASPTGSTPQMTLTGGNLSAVSIRVCGNLASISAQSSGSVTFHWPSNTASSTPCNIVASNSGGSATLSNVVRVLPASIAYAWYCGQGFVAGTSWTDLVSGVVATVSSFGSGFTAPGFNSSWNGSCALNFTLAGNDFVATFPSAITQNGSAFHISDFVTIDSSTASLVFDGLTSANRWMSVYTNTPTFDIDSFQGGSGNAIHAGTAPVAHQACLVTGDWAGASSNIAINNGTPTTGTFTAPASLPGVTMGTRFDGIATANQRFNGNLAMIGFTAGGGTVFSGADLTILQGDFTGQW